MSKISKTPWLYYAITVVIITILFILRETDIMVVGVAGYYGLCPATRFFAIALAFALALNMGLNHLRFRWLYPFFFSFFAHLILPMVAFITCYRHVHCSGDYYFMYYLVLGFIFVFPFYLLVPLIGTGVGVSIRKKRIKEGQDL